MGAADIDFSSGWEDEPATFMDRLTGQDGVAITQASISSASYKIFDLNAVDPDAVISSGPLTVSTVVFDALQTDARWTKDTTGYNFRYTTVPTAFPIGDHRYRIEFVLIATNGDPIGAIHERYVKAKRGS